MSRDHVLAISPQLDDLRHLVSCLKEAEATVDAIRGVSELESARIGHRYVFVDIGDCRREELELILERCSPHAHVAVIIDNAPLAEFTTLLQDPRINHIISREEISTIVPITARKLLTGDIFGIEHYLPKGTLVHKCRLNDFQGRGKAIEIVQEFAKNNRVRSRLREGIGKVCEELLMNALYDAPVNESGEQVFAEIDPHDRVETCSPKPVSIRYAATDDLFAVAVRDRYGRLAKNTIISYIEKCLHSETQIDRKAYGAGLGLYIVANAAASYVVNVAYDIATEVICTFDLRARRPLRVVGVFVHPGAAEMLAHGPTPNAPYPRRGTDA